MLGAVRNWSGPASVPLKINSKKHRCVFRIQLGLRFKCFAVVINGFANRDYRAADSAGETLHVMNVSWLIRSGIKSRPSDVLPVRISYDNGREGAGGLHVLFSSFVALSLTLSPSAVLKNVLFFLTPTPLCQWGTASLPPDTSIARRRREKQTFRLNADTCTFHLM